MLDLHKGNTIFKFYGDLVLCHVVVQLLFALVTAAFR